MRAVCSENEKQMELVQVLVGPQVLVLGIRNYWVTVNKTNDDNLYKIIYGLNLLLNVHLKQS